MLKGNIQNVNAIQTFSCTNYYFEKSSTVLLLTDSTFSLSNIY